MVQVWRCVLVMLCLTGTACHGQLTSDEQNALVLGRQMQALRIKDYRAYMRYFLPTCKFTVSRDHSHSLRDHREDAVTATQWQQRIEREIGDAIVEKATLSVWNFLAQYLTLKTTTGMRKIIRMDVSYTLENTADGLRVRRAVLTTFRVTSAGPYADERSLLGRWAFTSMDDPKGNTVTNDAVIAKYGFDLEFLNNGTVVFHPREGSPPTAASLTGHYRLLDASHLSIEAPHFSEVWTIERPVPRRDADSIRLEKAGVPRELLVGFPQHYYILLHKPDRFQIQLER